LREAYPKEINGIELSYGSNNEIITTTVGMSFRYWEPIDASGGSLGVADKILNTVRNTIERKIDDLDKTEINISNSFDSRFGKFKKNTELSTDTNNEAKIIVGSKVKPISKTVSAMLPDTSGEKNDTPKLPKIRAAIFFNIRLLYNQRI
jgi:hypothetical protein